MTTQPQNPQKKMRKDFVLPDDENDPILSSFTTQTHRAIFFVLIALLTVTPLLSAGVTVYVRTLIICVTAGMVALWILGQCSGLEGHLLSTLLNPPVLTLGAYAIIRYGLSDVEAVARRDILMIFIMTLLFFVVINVIRHRWQYGVLIAIGIGTGMVVALEGIWQLLRTRSGLAMPSIPIVNEMVRGGFSNPVEQLTYMHLVFPLAAADFLFSRRPLIVRILEAFACVILFTAMLVVGRLHAMPACMASILVLLIYILRKRGWKFRWATAGMVALVVASGIALWAILSTTPGASSGGDNSVRVSHSDTAGAASKTMGRAQIPAWRSVVTMVLYHPWIGIGPGMFPWRFSAYHPEPLNSSIRVNSGLVFFAEYGLAGIGIGLWIITAYAVATVWILKVRARRYSASTPSNRYAFAVAGLAMAAAAVTDAILNNGFCAYANQVFVTVIAAATVTSGLHDRGGDPSSDHARGRRSLKRLTGLQRGLLTVCTFLALLLFLWLITRASIADVFSALARNDVANKQLLEAEDHYKKAIHYDSRNGESVVALGDLCLSRNNDGDHKHAISLYERALVLNPYATPLRLKLAGIFDVDGEQNKANEQYQLAVQNEPNNFQNRLAIGAHYLLWKDYDGAREAYRKAAELNPACTNSIPTITATNAPPPTTVISNTPRLRATNHIAGVSAYIK